MAAEYSVEVCRKLEERFRQAGLHRPMRVSRYDTGKVMEYDVTEVGGQNKGRVRLYVQRFVGGGFAGQVYQVRVLEIESEGDGICGLEQGKIYAMKILIPPSGFSRLFRDFLYRIGFQGAFQLQVNPDAARSGALWQKFIRRAAEMRFGGEKAVNDIHATFVDETIGSCGELSDWVDGRTWRLEVDERMDVLRRWNRGRDVDDALLGSAEYRSKKVFMRDFVKLLHEMGAYEFARQYEWSTCKSQPNCLKKRGMDNEPGGGLVAVDFRAGLALLPFLPMSPGDIKLIIKGLWRGSLVQFDRGDIGRLEEFVDRHSGAFADMRGTLDELKATEEVYRNSVPDISHNHVRLLYSGKLWSTMFGSAVTGWKVRNIVDQKSERKLRSCKVLTTLFFLLGAIPLLGKFLRKITARADWRKHYASMVSSAEYFRRAFYGKMAEKVIEWHRGGRVNEAAAIRVAESPRLFLCHMAVSILPGGIHRFLTDSEFRREKLVYIFVRPLRLYFNAEYREQWLRDMVTEGQRKNMLSEDDSEAILSQIKEPFIQKYLKSLAVHVCTLPVTQVVSFTIAVIYVLMHPEMPKAEAWAIGAGIIVFFQVVPISPGSLCRGLYVVYLVIRERNFRDYNIAVFLGFFKYVGYLAFPIQMTHRYPALARFMAGHWATEAVHIVPVFGERGALLEHWVFCLFYNWPLTIRGRMQRRSERRAAHKARYWHAGLCVMVGAGVFSMTEYICLDKYGVLPGLRDIWWLVLGVSFLCGAVVTLGAGGAALWKRFISGTVCGAGIGLFYMLFTVILCMSGLAASEHLISAGVWRLFIFSILTTTGAIVTEIILPERGIC